MRALVPLAPGFEEMEAVIIIDVLRRAEVEVTVAGLDGAGPTTGSRGVVVHADVSLDDALPGTYDAIVLPGGGPGTARLREDERLLAALREHHGAGRLTAAVCAAPLALSSAGLAEGRSITAHPSVHDELSSGGANVSSEAVVKDGVILTSQGPGTSMEFALAVVRELKGSALATEIANAMRHPANPG